MTTRRLPRAVASWIQIESPTKSARTSTENSVARDGHTPSAINSEAEKRVRKKIRNLQSAFDSEKHRSRAAEE
jgi:hypothetical protein